MHASSCHGLSSADSEILALSKDYITGAFCWMEVLVTFSNPRKFHRQKEFRSVDATDSNALLVWWQFDLTRNGDVNTF